MKNLNRVALTALLCAAILLSGCTMAVTGRAKVDPQSFEKDKTYALVTIAATKEFYGEKGLSQMFRKKEDIKGINTQPVIDELVPVIRARLAQTGYFTSMPMKTIVNSPPYRKLIEDEKVQKVAFIENHLNVAGQYKYISDPQKLAGLARDLNVDGVICVIMNFSVQTMKSGVYIPVGTFGRKQYAASAGITAIAYDREGNVAWKDTTMKQAEPGDKRAIVVLDLTDWAATDFEKMHPSAVLVGGYAVDVLVQRFRDTMAGKKTSIFQKVRDKGSKEATKTKS